LGILGIVILLKNILIVSFNYFKSQFAAQFYEKKSKILFNYFINNNFQKNILKNPSELIRKISSDVNTAADFINLRIELFKECILLVLIISLFLYLQKQFVFIIFLIFLITSIVIFKSLKNFLKKITLKLRYSQTRIIKLINQTFGSLKENIIYRNNSVLIKNFNSEVNNLKIFQFFSTFFTSLPRIIFECLTFLIILFATFSFRLQNLDNTVIFETLALIGIISLRLIPSFNSITFSISLSRTYKIFFDIVYKDSYNFSKNNFTANKNVNKIFFKNTLDFKNIFFKHIKSSKYIFKNSSISLKKNKVIGIYGPSGLGKTTLVDIILGLLKVKSIKILLDNKHLYNNKNFVLDNRIGYVPQSPYLLDGSIKQNIIFGRERYKVSTSQINIALKRSKMYDLVNDYPEKINLHLGNNASRLSGGQKQRIVLARALLLNPDILILDEATSALDENTEKEILKDIFNLRRYMTILIITHNLDIIERCDMIYKVDKQKIIKIK
jgi:ABC-type multidrug transport system fused ATPase/permease subunit